MSTSTVAYVTHALSLPPNANALLEIRDNLIALIPTNQLSNQTPISFPPNKLPKSPLNPPSLPTHNTQPHNATPFLSEKCLTCPLFITTAEFLPQHRKQLDDTRALISRAQTDGHTRLAEMNRTVETNLLTIIATLETDQRDCRCAAAGSETCCGKESSDAP